MPRKTPRRWLAPELPPRYQAASHAISGMPIYIKYEAILLSVQQITRFERPLPGEPFPEQGETIFTWSFEDQGPIGEPTSLNASALANEFFAVETEADALNFLRHAGPFVPINEHMEAEISWPDFQQWQRYASHVRQRKALAATHLAVLENVSAEELAQLDPSGELRLSLRALSGELNTIFPWPAGLDPKLVEVKVEERRVDNLAAFRDGFRFSTDEDSETLQSKVTTAVHKEYTLLQRSFAAPPSDRYTIEFMPSQPTAPGYAHTPGAYACLVEPEGALPILRLRPQCALEAIAATVYADRIAGLVTEKCPGCNKLFHVHGQKTYCSVRCKNLVGSREFRAKKKAKETSGKGLRARRPPKAVTSPGKGTKRRATGYLSAT